MVELERRAILGDTQAQEECTNRGIMLPCPFCGGAAMIDYDTIEPFEYAVFCGACGVMPITSEDKRVAISAWNTRQSPPIGRCGECVRADELDENGWIFCNDMSFGMKIDGFCSDFVPKEVNGNKDKLL